MNFVRCCPEGVEEEEADREEGALLSLGRDGDDNADVYAIRITRWRGRSVMDEAAPRVLVKRWSCGKIGAADLDACEVLQEEETRDAAPTSLCGGNASLWHSYFKLSRDLDGTDSGRNLTGRMKGLVFGSQCSSDAAAGLRKRYNLEDKACARRHR